MDVNELKSRLRSGDMGGCYLLGGEEDYLKKYYLGQIRLAVLGEDQIDPFAHSVFDGPELDFGALEESVKSPPMMWDKKLIEWRYPNFDKMKDGELELLDRLLTLLGENPSVTLVFLVNEGDIDLGTPKRESKLAKRLGQSVNLLRFDRSTDTQLLPWLKKHFDSRGVEVGRGELEALIFRSGHSMTALHGEVTKLCAYATVRSGRDGQPPRITVADVENVASSIPESEAFALSNAILQRDKVAAYRALEEMKLRRVDPIVIMAMMSKTYNDIAMISMMIKEGLDQKDLAEATGMNAYRLKLYLGAAKSFDRGRGVRILEELSRTDVASKFGGISGYTAVDIFVARCL